MDSVQLFDYFFVLDFEATCIKDMRINPQEIIEFTCSKINAVTFKEEVEPFHRYVKPVFRPKLSPFCIRLTGITQETVAEARIFKDVLSAFSAWTRSHMTPSSVFVTCGEWPLKTMLPGQCQLSRLQVPSFMTRWICLREEFYRLKRKNVKPWEQKRRLTVMKMLEAFELEIQGKENSGKDDVKNMTVLLKRLCHLGQLRISKASAAPVQRQEQELVSSEQVLQDLLRHNHLPQQQDYGVFLLLCLRTACPKNDKSRDPEIIELACAALDSTSDQTLDTFESLVRPTIRNRLPPVCTKLTTITQRMVDESEDFAKTFHVFSDWLHQFDDKNGVFVTVGDHELGVVMPRQLEIAGLAAEGESEETCFKKWVDVKATLEEITKSPVASSQDADYTDGLHQAMDLLGLKVESSLCRAKDGVKNLAQVLTVMQRLIVLRPNKNL